MTHASHSDSGLPIGTLLDGKYQILGVLGVGGMGEVYKAEHVHLDALRCIKVMKSALAADEGFRARFVREARTATRVHHPNVAVVHDFSVSAGGVSYLVSEFIDGLTLRQWIREHGRFDVGLAADIAIQVLSGLHEIHKLGLVHRDISSENIMVEYRDERWVAKIIDLGIAKALEAPAAEKTQVGFFVGNPRYSSPEQLGDLPDGEDIDGRSDLYSLGIVIYEMVVGDTPFTSKTPHGYILKHLRDEPRGLPEALPEEDWPPGFEPALMKALAKKRDQRYASAREFARCLQPFAAIGTSTHEVDIREFLTQSTRGVPLTVRTDVSRTDVDETSDTVENDLRVLIGREASDAFERALDENSPAAWRLFLERHGDADRAAEAKDILTALEQAAFDHFVDQHDPSALSRFIGEFPASRFAEEARLLTAQWRDELQMEQAWAAACKADSIPLYRAFALTYPQQRLAQEARLKIEEHEALGRIRRAAAATDLIGLRTIERVAAHLPRALEAVQQALEEIEHSTEQHRIAEHWDAAWRSGRSEEIRAFLDLHPGSPFQEDADIALAEALAFERIVPQNDLALLEDFLVDFPHGRHFAEARIRAAELARSSRASREANE